MKLFTAAFVAAHLASAAFFAALLPEEAHSWSIEWTETGRYREFMIMEIIAALAMQLIWQKAPPLNGTTGILAAIAASPFIITLFAVTRKKLILAAIAFMAWSISISGLFSFGSHNDAVVALNVTGRSGDHQHRPQRVLAQLVQHVPQRRFHSGRITTSPSFDKTRMRSL